MPETLTFGSLFSGIQTGGLDLGLERAGMECRFQVEIDDYCRRVLTKHWPDVPKYGDIKELSGHELESVDLICGGFPCQPVSLAGKGLAQADERWLWPEFARIVRVVRPRFVLVENVPGLLGRGMGDVLGDLAALGFDAEWESLPAAVFGAPHVRNRVWILAYSASEGLPERQTIIGGSGQTGRQARVPEHGTWWTTEPELARVVDGLSGRVDRVRALGNAVVPQVVQFIGERIVAYAAAESRAA